MASTKPPVLLINTDAAEDRLAFMAAQLDVLGLPFERIAAVTPETLAPPQTNPMWHRWQRPLRVTEMALTASHMAAWRRARDLNCPCLVLEDDALLARDLPSRLNDMLGLAGVDHISLETRGRKKLVARRGHPSAPVRRLYQDRTGSAAMLIWPSGAEKLLSRAARAAAPSDALIADAPGLLSYQADPALAIQLDQCADHGLRAPLPLVSTIDAVEKPSLDALSPSARRAFRRRRWAAQARMGAKALRYFFVAERRSIAVVKAWADPRV